MCCVREEDHPRGCRLCVCLGVCRASERYQKKSSPGRWWVQKKMAGGSEEDYGAIADVMMMK